jgi:hypothetical protein
MKIQEVITRIYAGSGFLFIFIYAFTTFADALGLLNYKENVTILDLITFFFVMAIYYELGD